MEELRPDSPLRHEEDPAYQRREWRFSSASWIVLTAVFFASLLGAFGNGVLSRAEAGQRDGLRVRYERVARFGSSIRLEITDPRAGSPLRIDIDQSLLDALRIEQITPAPISTQLAAGGVAFEFARETGATSPVIFDLEPIRAGMVRGSIHSAGAAVAIRQFILP
jgi:hypothetical protein